MPQLRTQTALTAGYVGKCCPSSQARCPLDEVCLLLRVTWQVLHLRGHASMSQCGERQAGAEMSGPENVVPSAVPLGTLVASIHEYRFVL